MDNEENKTCVSGPAGSYWYDQTDLVDEKRAWMAAFKISSEKHDEIMEKNKKKTEEFDKQYPFTRNLHFVNGELFYLDEKGKRIEFEDGLKAIGDKLSK